MIMKNGIITSSDMFSWQFPYLLGHNIQRLAVELQFLQFMRAHQAFSLGFKNMKIKRQFRSSDFLHALEVAMSKSFVQTKLEVTKV